MVGPYIAAKMPGQHLYFDARAAWGLSDNKISPTNTYEDSFDTERWMASAQISGKMKLDAVTIVPAVSVSYFEETQKAYTDSLSNRIPKQTFSQGEVRAGPTFSREFVRDDGIRLIPSFGISGVWNFDLEDTTASQGTTLGTEDFRVRFDAGIRTLTTDSWYVDLNGFYDGVGASDYYSYGGRAKLTVPLQ
jgi:outer membrane autotransporter protein